MDDIVFAGNRALYLILVMSAGPIAVATFVGLLVGLFQTVTQLQEQPLPRRLLFRSWAWTATWQWEWCCLPLALYLPWLWEWPWSITGSEKDGVHM